MNVLNVLRKNYIEKLQTSNHLNDFQQVGASLGIFFQISRHKQC